MSTVNTITTMHLAGKVIVTRETTHGVVYPNDIDGVQGDLFNEEIRIEWADGAQQHCIRIRQPRSIDHVVSTP